MLYESPQISDVVRAGCCKILAYNESGDLDFPREALKLYEERLALDPESKSSDES